MANQITSPPKGVAKGHTKINDYYGNKKVRPPYKKEPPPYIKKKEYYKKTMSSKIDYKYNKMQKPSS